MTPFRVTPVALIILFVAGMVGAEPIKPLMPISPEQDEGQLLADARAVVAVELEGGYQQYDLVVARVGTWDEPRDLTVRLFLPPGEAKQPRPLLAYVHGGGFIGGSPDLNLHAKRSAFSPAIRALLDEGYAVVSLGYRLAREAGWPAPISDTLCGLRFMSAHGKHWGIDGSRVGILGHSAGARTVALLSMVPHDAYHIQDLPWREAQVNIVANWLWAGSPLASPEVTAWEEFGKPRQYSVPRLHFGEHPAWDLDARHRLRVRHNPPHLSRTMPPLYLLRGASDYGGNHADAEHAVKLWKALGVPVTLNIVPGGHNATGPVESMTAFFNQHLRKQPYQRPEPDPIADATSMIEAGEPMFALEILAAMHTTDGGRRAPAGQWILLSDDRMLWLIDEALLNDASAPVARRARRLLAEAEADAARDLLDRREWYRANAAARNVLKLVADDPAMQKLAHQAAEASEREAGIFRTLHAANHAVHAGDTEKALTLLSESEDPRIVRARARVGQTDGPESFAKPTWASATGRDVYGRWLELKIDEEHTIRLRYVEPGSWDLPEYLHYRNRTSDPWTKQVKIEDGFWLAETPVTVAQWRSLMPDPDAPELTERSGQRPQAGIDYLQIIDWLEKLKAQHDGLVVRLPTESEWLHAATLGGRTDVQAGTDLHSVHALSVDPKEPGPGPVDSVVPDLGGFYSLLGGVQEWTSSPGRHTARFTDDRGRHRVMAYPIARGGAWSSMPQQLGFEVRNQHRHGNRQPDLGFRIAIGGSPDANWLADIEK